MTASIAIPFMLALLPAVQCFAAGADDGRAALEAYLSKVKGAQSGRILSVTEDVGAFSSAGWHFYVVRFRSYPVKPPEPLKANNLFAIGRDKSVDWLADCVALKGFFREHLPPVKSDADGRNALKAWLRFAEELHQDGYYTFRLSADSVGARVEGDKRIAFGEARVIEGGDGYVKATIKFDKAGKVLDASAEVRIKASGARPAGSHAPSSRSAEGT